jgi:hypothetical protein
MKIIDYVPLLAGIWALANGILHNIAVWVKHKTPYDRDLQRLLMDGLILSMIGAIYLIAFFNIKSGYQKAWWYVISASFSLLTYSIIILPFFKSKAFVGIALFLCLISIFGIKANAQNNSIKNNLTMDKTEIINQYINSWNERGELKRMELLKICFAEKGIYLDPHIPKPVSNLAEMNEMIKTFQTRLPHKLLKNSEPEFHNSIFRMQWKMDNNGSVLSYGTFVGEFDNTNKICRVYCFIDKFIGQQPE